jgi:hypothetical protein
VYYRVKYENVSSQSQGNAKDYVRSIRSCPEIMGTRRMAMTPHFSSQFVRSKLDPSGSRLTLHSVPRQEPFLFVSHNKTAYNFEGEGHTLAGQ